MSARRAIARLGAGFASRAGSGAVCRGAAGRRPSLAAVLFYGSCLRRATDGVLDFPLVDGYPGTYASRGLALANAALPPTSSTWMPMRAGGCARSTPSFAARFARAVEPSALARAGALRPAGAALGVRDDAARDALHAAISGRTAVPWARAAAGDATRAAWIQALWLGSPRDSGSELRPESDEAARGLRRGPVSPCAGAAAALEAQSEDAFASVAWRGRLAGRVPARLAARGAPAQGAAAALLRPPRRPSC
jgi:hypothetical protein